MGVAVMRKMLALDDFERAAKSHLPRMLCRYQGAIALPWLSFSRHHPTILLGGTILTLPLSATHRVTRTGAAAYVPIELANGRSKMR
jgi:hypothetical protein